MKKKEKVHQEQPKEEIDKRKLFGTIIGGIFFIGCILFFTYAWYVWRGEDTEFSFIIQEDLTVCEQGPDVHVENIGPVLDYHDGVGATFKIQNMSGEAATFSLSLNITSISEPLLVSSFKYILLKGNFAGTSFSETEIKGDFSAFQVGNNIISATVPIDATSSHTFKFIVYIDGTIYNDTNMMESSMNSNLVIGDCGSIGTVTSNGKDIYSLMKKNAIMDNTSSEFVSSSSGVDFSSISSDTNGKGIYLRAGTENDTYPIYYYRGDVTNNNVLFANFCWKIVRTTETGGTKLIYNGTPTNGTCDNTGESSQIGTSAFNSNWNSPADVGYMFGTRYTYTSRAVLITKSFLGRFFINSSSALYYGTSITYSDGTYTLNSAEAHTWSSDYSSLSGYYTCRSTSTSCSTVYYIVATDSSYMYTLSMSSGNLLNDVNTSFVLGSSVTDNGDGTYTLSNTTTIQKSDWFSNYDTYNNYYTCYSTSTTCSDMYYITSTSNYQMDSSNMANNYVYGNTVSYSDGTYTLSNTKSFWNWNENYNTLNSNHYTCFSTGTTCSTVYYIYYTSSSTAYYISLTNGKTVENVLSEMLSESSNENDSTIKTTIDTWYQNNMTEYTDNYLEDTVWCNDRSIGTLNGWDPNGGSTNSYLHFSSYDRVYSTYQPSLNCSNPNDRFTVSSENGNGKLTYPVALLTADEIMLAGGRGHVSNVSYYLYTGKAWFLMSPSEFDNSDSVGIRVSIYGSFGHPYVGNAEGIRPVISLRYGVEISSGDGTVTNPYKIL